ncbi:hypothetical protein [Marinomonas sp. IMCC 4694]|uniref:hypothetical protein n=1 Tax=Marinomonas sp. IMCC 4694 TaxID=2605432 RepID=UPI0011E6BA3F|nr:hypothetical protein [Marinomonas sp. IMCC 4694]TYL48338.1 hypothetical protein FXV75_10515 [Marinomonas sp. IMCC 4694]
MIRTLINIGIIVMSLQAIPLVYGDNLVAFGTACLAKEALLKEAENRLNDRTTIDADDSTAKGTRDALVGYETEQNQLNEAITQCLETTPNSAYCHQVRRRQNELAYLIEKSKATTLNSRLANALDKPDVFAQNDITQEQVKQQHERFIALCRDSDTHYSLIQNSDAYREVCHSEQAKHTITCSFF